MGCMQSQPERPLYKKKKKVSNPSTPTQEELEAARLLAAKAQQTPPKASEQAPRRETDVLRRADAMDRAHEAALKSPSLQKLEVKLGDQTQRLLDGFAEREADAHAQPELRNVEATDLRTSKLYNVLRGFEEKEEKARSEPKLEKTFSERERERSQIATPHGSAVTGSLAAATTTTRSSFGSAHLPPSITSSNTAISSLSTL